MPTQLEPIWPANLVASFYICLRSDICRSRSRDDQADLFGIRISSAVSSAGVSQAYLMQFPVLGVTETGLSPAVVLLFPLYFLR